MGHVKLVVEATEDGERRVENLLGEYAEHLAVQRVFGYAIMVVEARLCCPADVERAGYVGAAPIENLFYLVPIVYLFEIKMLQWCASDDESVELLRFHHFEVAVEGTHVFHRSVLAGVSLHLHQVDFQLQRRVGKDSDEVGLCCYFQRHQVQYGDAQGAYVLVLGTRVPHDEYVFLLQQFYGRKPVG